MAKIQTLTTPNTGVSIEQQNKSESEAALSCPTLCDPMDCSPPGSSVHGIFQARVLEWVAIAFSRESSQPRDLTWVSHTVGRCFTVWAKLLSHFSRVRLCATPQMAASLPLPWDSPGKNTGVGCHFLLQCMKVKSESEVAQSYPTLSDPMDCSLPGSSVHGLCQARVVEWGAIAFSSLSQKLSFIAGGNTKWYSHFGRQLAVSYKTKHTLTISSNWVP